MHFFLRKHTYFRGSDILLDLKVMFCTRLFLIGSIFNVPLQTKTAFLGPFNITYLDLSEGTDRVRGQLHGDKDRLPLHWRDHFERRCWKRGFECGMDMQYVHGWQRHSRLVPAPVAASRRRCGCALVTVAQLDVEKVVVVVVVVVGVGVGVGGRHGHSEADDSL